MAIEIVDFPIKNGGSFHSYVNVYQAGYIWRLREPLSHTVSVIPSGHQVTSMGPVTDRRKPHCVTGVYPLVNIQKAMENHHF